MQDTECFVLESSMFHINYCPSCFRLTHDLTFNCYHATTKGVDLDLLILDLQDSYFCIACCVRWALYMEKRLFGWLSGAVTFEMQISQSENVAMQSLSKLWSQHHKRCQMGFEEANSCYQAGGGWDLLGMLLLLFIFYSLENIRVNQLWSCRHKINRYWWLFKAV